jgi:U32 family peptidase
LISAGVDAAIVQDIGICRLIRQLSPDFPIHASTQMTITSAAGVEFARELGCNLVVLARECSIKEIAQIAPAAHAAVGGVCAWRVVRGLFRAMPDQRGAGRTLGQSRRMRPGLPHALRIDQRRPIGAAGRPPLFLSPQDLAGLEVLPDLVARRRGFAENRRPAQIARIRGQHHASLSAGAGQKLSRRRDAQTRYKLEMAFSRGLAHGLVRRHQQSTAGPRPIRQEARCFSGEVQRLRAESVFLHLQAPLKPGTALFSTPGSPTRKRKAGG